jgi:hypothetical protein
MSEITSVTLAVDSRQVKTATEALKQFASTGGIAGRAAGGLGKAFGSIPFAKIATGFVGAAAGLAAFVKSSINAADAASKAAQAAGVSTESYTQLAFAAKLSGVEAEQLGLAFTQLNQKIADGSTAITGLGISLKNTDGSFRAADEVLEDLADEFQRLPDGVEKTAKAVELFGARAGPRLIPLLNQGKAGIKGFREEADRLGVTISTKTGRASEEFNDNITKLSASLRGFGNLIARETVPTLARLSSRLLENAKDVGIARGAFITFFESVFGETSPVAVGQKKLADLEVELNKVNQAIANVGSGRRADERLRKLNGEARALELQINQTRQAIEQFRGDEQKLGAGGPSAGLASASRNTIAALQEQVKQLRAVRDTTDISSASFRQLTSEIEKLERQISAASGRRSNRGASEVLSESQKYLASLRSQLEALDELSVEEVLLRDIQLGRLGNVNKAQQEELQNIARQIDARRALTKAEEEAKKEADELLQIKRQTAIAEFDLISARNESFQSLIDSTPSGILEKQRRDVEELTQAYREGAFGIAGSAEAIEKYSEAVNTYLGNTQDVAKETNDIAKELGLVFTSAFEDAIVKGNSFSEVLRGIGQDILRITTRKLVTEPLGNLFSGLAKSALGSLGGLFSPRAIGGPVSRGGIYQVNERGPELLNIGGRQLLMMGNNQGTVQPNSQVGGSGQMVNITVNVPIGAPKDRATALQFGRDISRQLSLAQSRNG